MPLRKANSYPKVPLRMHVHGLAVHSYLKTWILFDMPIMVRSYMCDLTEGLLAWSLVLPRHRRQQMF